MKEMKEIEMVETKVDRKIKRKPTLFQKMGRKIQMAQTVTKEFSKAE